jgi:predicted DNA binding CopG/RHH family protein
MKNNKKKSVLVAVRMSEEQQNALTVKARAAGLTVPDYIRNIANIQEPTPEKSERSDDALIARIDSLLASHLEGMRSLLDG